MSGHGSTLRSPGGGSGSTAGSSDGESLDSIYQVTPTNWYKSLPYGFSFFDRQASGVRTSIFYLPILPSNINVTTQFATNIVTTLYGVVEEHSEVRYYDIEIAGTTGIAPRWVDEKKQGNSPSSVTPDGRTAFQNTGIDLGGFLPEVTNTISQVKDAVQDIGNALNGGPSMKTGVDASKSGYMAFHNFYRFLLKYKKDAAGISGLGNTQRKTHPLQFLNHKDRIKYDVVIQSFTLSRNADNPMLYNYSIKMRGYNLRNVDASPPEQDQLAKLGLGDIRGQSAFSSLTSAVGSAATLVGGLL